MNKDDRQDVINALRQVRDDGHVNMFDKQGVVRELIAIDEYLSAEIVTNADPSTYIGLLESI